MEARRFMQWVALLSAGCAAAGQSMPPAPKGPSQTAAAPATPSAAPSEPEIAPSLIAELPPPPDCASWQPDPGCEGAGIVRRDCEAMASTLSSPTAQRAFDCASEPRATPAVCGFHLAECVREELIEHGGAARPHPECSTLVAECTARRDARQARHGKSRFEPWLVSEGECNAAFAEVNPEFAADLASCLRFSCHPTACFMGSPAGLLARRAHEAQRQRR
jgi:hypothetical protein